MRKHFTLDSLTSITSKKKTSTREKKSYSGKKTERYDVSPREFIIRNILNYSMALSVIQTKEAGCVKMMMN